MIDLLLVWVRLVIRFADTLGDDFGIALAMASIFAVGTLHSRSIFQKITAKSTPHDIVELLRDEFVALLLVNLLLLLSDSTLTIKTDIKWSSIFELFGYLVLAYRSSNSA